MLVATELSKCEGNLIVVCVNNVNVFCRVAANYGKA